MEAMQMADCIQLRGDTPANLTSVNPILALNEPVVIQGATPQLKIGDGVNPYNSLPTIGGGSGSAGTIAVGTVTTGVAGSSATVTNSGTSTAAVLDFAIPRGNTGVAGNAATIAVGTTTTGTANVTNVGTTSAAVLNFTVPQGIQGPSGNAATISVGTTTTGTANVTNVGTANAAVLNFVVPPGTPGTAATISIGTTTTGTAAVTNTGTSSAAILNFTLPQGIQGPSGTAATVALGTVTTGAAGSNVIISNSGTSSAATLNFTIPRGDTGATGSGGGGSSYYYNILDYNTGPHPVITGGSTDCSLGIQACIDAAAAAKVPVFIPPGTFLANNLSIPSNMEVFGVGDNSILIQPITNVDFDSLLWINKNSGAVPSVANNKRSIYLHNFKMVGKTDLRPNIITGNLTLSTISSATPVTVTSGAVYTITFATGTISAMSNVTLSATPLAGMTMVFQAGATSTTITPSGTVTGLKICAFNEKISLIAMAAVSDVVLDSLTFIGFLGDGLYLGPNNSVETHAENILVTRCKFDGIDNSQRNSISIIDGNNITIEKSTFKNSTNTYEPGCIDIEPNDDAYAVIKNIKIRQNRFSHCGGHSCVSLALQPSIVNVGGLTIDSNIFEDMTMWNGALYLSHGRSASITAATPRNNIKVTNNVIKGQTGTNAGYLVNMDGLHGVKFQNNIFSDCLRSFILANPSETYPKCIDVSFEGNVFERITDGSVFYIGDNDQFNFSANNKVIDCPGWIFEPLSGKTSTYMSIKDNVFNSPNASTNDIFHIGLGHNFTQAQNSYFHNKTITYNTPGSATWIAWFTQT
jgi:hypothetical protein